MWWQKCRASKGAFEAPRGRISRAVVKEGNLGGDVDILNKNREGEKREARAVGQRNLFACERHQVETLTRDTAQRGAPWVGGEVEWV